MTAFDFVFSLFGLLLGLSLAEVLSGAARTVEARGSVRLGWLSPLLGLVIMLDLTSFWSVAWSLRAVIPASYATLVVGLMISGIYYFASCLVFPKDLSIHTDLDAHYFRRRREILGAVITADTLVFAAILLLGVPPVRGATRKSGFYCSDGDSFLC